MPPVPWISHNEWRKLTHNPLGIALLKATLKEDFSIPEAVSHILVDGALPWSQRKVLAKLLGGK